MTDNEIIKALVCCKACSFPEYCGECPYVEFATVKGCVDEMLTDVLDLINRQRAEIERLRNTVKTDFLTVTEKLKLSQSEISEIRAEAIKGFAERLKEKSKKRVSDICGARVYVGDIDNLVKEMMEDRE